MPPDPNIERLESTKANDPVIGPLVDAYRADLVEMERGLRASIGRCDWQAVYEIAHAIKGNASMYGFEPLSEIASVLCGACASKSIESERLAQELASLCARAAA